MKSVNKYITESLKGSEIHTGFAFTTLPILGVCLLFIILEVVARTRDLLLYIKTFTEPMLLKYQIIKF